MSGLQRIGHLEMGAKDRNWWLRSVVLSGGSCSSGVLPGHIRAVFESGDGLKY